MVPDCISEPFPRRVKSTPSILAEHNKCATASHVRRSTEQAATAAAVHAFTKAQGMSASLSHRPSRSHRRRKSTSAGPGSHFARARNSVKKEDRIGMRNALHGHDDSPRTKLWARAAELTRLTPTLDTLNPCKDFSRPGSRHQHDSGEYKAAAVSFVTSTPTRVGVPMKKYEMARPMDDQRHDEAEARAWGDRSTDIERFATPVHPHAADGNANAVRERCLQDSFDEQMQSLRTMMSVSFHPAQEESKNKNKNNSGKWSWRKPSSILSSQDLSRALEGSNTVSSKMRRIPSSLKNIYRRKQEQGSNGHAEVLPQQLPARHSHVFGSGSWTEFDTSKPQDARAEITNLYLAQDRPPTPPLHMSYPLFTARDFSAETKNLPELEPTVAESSRISSWANSSNGATVVPVERDEPCNTDHAGKVSETSCASQALSASNNGAVTQSTSHCKHNLQPSTREPTDSQRMYSALMKRIGSIRKAKGDQLPMANTNGSEEEARQAETERKGVNGHPSPLKERSRPLSSEKHCRSTIRIVEDDESLEDSARFPQQQDITLVTDCLRIPFDGRNAVVSPSIYSERPGHDASNINMSSVSLPGRVNSPTGTATISESQQHVTWSLEVDPQRSNPNMAGRDRMTSNDWRAWLSNSTANFDGESARLASFNFDCEHSDLNAHSLEIDSQRHEIVHTGIPELLPSDVAKTDDAEPSRVERDVSSGRVSVSLDELGAASTRIDSQQILSRHVSENVSNHGMPAPLRETSGNLIGRIRSDIASRRASREEKNDPTDSIVAGTDHLWPPDPSTVLKSDETNTQKKDQAHSTASKSPKPRKAADRDDKRLPSKIPTLATDHRTHAATGTSHQSPSGRQLVSRADARSPIDERFLRRIQRGPYLGSTTSLPSSSPSPAKTEANGKTQVDNVSHKDVDAATSSNRLERADSWRLTPSPKYATIGIRRLGPGASGSELTPPRVRQQENTPPSGGQRMAEEWLKGKKGPRGDGSSPVFV